MANIAENFDQFRDSINSLWEMEVEMGQISKSIKALKQKNSQIKSYIT